jgi:protein gp37
MSKAQAIPRSIARSMTGIEWTDFTGNPWIGCTEVPASSGGRSGCTICYAKTFAGRRLGIPWGPGSPRQRCAGFANRMHRLDRLAARTGFPFSVFSLSLGDWLDPEIAPSWRAEMIDVVEACPHLTWLLLTHRAHLARRLLPGAWCARPPANVWAGVTVDHPAHAHRWRPHAEFWGHTGRAWVSAEPLAASLGGVEFPGAICVIIGGASGTGDPSWEFDPAWAREALDRYGEERVFFKQFGDFRDGRRVGKKAAGRDLDGRLLDRTPWPRHRELLREAAAS